MAKEKKTGRGHDGGCDCGHHHGHEAHGAAKHAKSDEENTQALQQKYAEYQMFEQQMKAMQEQMEKFEQQMMEITTISEQLMELKNVKVNSDMLVPIANGIFVKGKILDNKDVLVNVGAGVTVKKSVDKTIELLKEQAEEIEKYRMQVAAQIEVMSKRGHELEEQLQRMIG